MRYITMDTGSDLISSDYHWKEKYDKIVEAIIKNYRDERM